MSSSNGVEPFQEPTNDVFNYGGLTIVKCYAFVLLHLMNALWNKIRVLLGWGFGNLRLLTILTV